MAAPIPWTELLLDPRAFPSTLLVAVMMFALALLARTVVLGLARLRLALALLFLLLLRISPLLVAALIVLGMLLVMSGLTALLPGIPVLVCHWTSPRWGVHCKRPAPAEVPSRA